jgi:hypothetical protein
MGMGLDKMHVLQKETDSRYPNDEISNLFQCSIHWNVAKDNGQDEQNHEWDERS